MSSLPEMSARPASRAIPVLLAAVWVASLVLLVSVYPQGTPVSADPGSLPVPYWVTLLPAAVGIALVLAIPPRSPRRPALVSSRRPFAITTAVLVALAIAFPIVVAGARLDAEWYALAKIVLLILIPAAALLIFRRGVTIEWNRDASRWWAPAVVIVVWTLLSQVAPWNDRFDLGDYDPLFLIVVALNTAITAGVGEELFYRRWLQTRLEAALGPWPGIALTALLFALMHLGSHGTGEPLIDVARVIVVQGSFGLFVGILWWRYRNLLANIVVHVIVNGWAVGVALLDA